MKNRKLSITIMVVTTLALIAWDIWVYITPEKGDTISEIIAFYSDHPLLPFAFGVLIGHWFWPQPRKKRSLEIAKRL